MTSELDGVKLSGPPKVGRCPDRLPKPAPLHVAARARRGRSGVRVTVTVTVAIPGAGPTEQDVDRRPVTHATVGVGRAHAQTSDAGIATLKLPPLTHPGLHQGRASAGDTFVPAVTRVRIGVNRR